MKQLRLVPHSLHGTRTLSPQGSTQLWALLTEPGVALSGVWHVVPGNSSLLQVPGLCLTCLLQIRPAALQLLAPLHDVLGLGVPGGCEVSSGAQHLLHLSLVGSHLHPEFLPQNSMKGATSGHSLATGGPEQSCGCALQAEKGWGQRLGN